MSVLVKHGHNLDDIKNKYTVDQVHLFYRYAIEDEMYANRNTAIILSKALALYIPYADKKTLTKTHNDFKDLLDRFDPEAIEKKKKLESQYVKNPMKLFGRLGVVGALGGQ